MKLRVPWFCVVAIAAMWLTSCNNPQGSDGYTFERDKAQMIDPRPIVVRTYPDAAALKAAYAEQPTGRKLGEGEDLFGFSVINRNACTIHMVRPETRYRPEEYGHELTHCLYGNFHPGRDEQG